MKIGCMVVNGKTNDIPYSESYDDLDAINDFILTYEGNNNTNSSPKDTNSQNDAEPLITETSENKSAHTEEFHQSTQNSYLESKSSRIDQRFFDEPSVATIKMPFEVGSSEKSVNTDMIEERVFINVSTSTLSSTDEKYVGDSISNTIYSNLTMRKNNKSSKFIITKAEKVIECDILKMNHKKSKRPNIKTTVYNIGKVSAESLLRNSKKTTRDAKDIFGDRALICGDLKEYNPANRISDVLEVVKSDRSDEEDIQHRYFVGKVPSPIPILEAKEYAELKYREVYDLVQKKSKTGVMTTNYLKLIRNHMVCFRSKHVKYNELRHGMLFFDDPYDTSYCYPEKYTVDLTDSKLYMVTGNRLSFFNIIHCCNYRICRGDIYDVTDLEIQRIDTRNDKFMVHFNREGLSETIEIKNLDFIVFKDNEYYWFRCNSANTFIKWISCLQLRRT